MMGRSLGSSVEIAEGSARSGKFGEKVERIVMLLSIWLNLNGGKFDAADIADINKRRAL